MVSLAGRIRICKSFQSFLPLELLICSRGRLLFYWCLVEPHAALCLKIEFAIRAILVQYSTVELDGADQMRPYGNASPLGVLGRQSSSSPSPSREVADKRRFLARSTYVLYIWHTDLYSTGTSTALFIEHTALVIATNRAPVRRVPPSSRQRGEGDTVGDRSECNHLPSPR